MALSESDFRRLVVQPNLEEYGAEYDKIHRAFNAVAAVDAYAAHIYYSAADAGTDPFAVLGLPSPRVKDDNSFRQALAQQYAEFKILRDLAKANKHAKLTRHSPSVQDSGQVTSATKGYGTARWGEGRYGGVSQVFVTDETGFEHYVETLVRKSVEMLDATARSLSL